MKELLVEERKSTIQVQGASNFGDYPFYTSGDSILKHDQFLLDGEYIFLATGGKANVKYYKGKVAYSTDTYVVKSEKHTTKYLYYLLLGKLEFINANLFTGSGLKHLQKKDLKKLKVQVPTSITEQTHIATILSTADEAIAQTEQLIAKYQRIKTGLMQDLLTKGIDEHGNIRDKATHRFVVKNGVELPVEWEVVELGEVCTEIQDGTHFSPKTIPDGAFMYVTSKNIRFGFLDFSNIEFVSEFDHRNIHKSCPVEYGDVLLTKDGANTGNASINNLKEEFSLLSSVCLIRGKNNILDNEFLLNLILCERGQRLIKDSMSGLAITRVTLQIINKLVFPLPLIKEQIEIRNRLKAFDENIIQYQHNLQKLHSIKTGLMQDLLSGRVRVNDLKE